MILIVDDDEALAETCSMFLEAQGYQVSIANCGREALDMIKAESPELLISDCLMPGMSGTELSDEVRGAESGAHFPILLMSGSRRGEVSGNGNFDGFLRKPFLAENLLIEVHKLLADLPAAPQQPN